MPIRIMQWAPQTIACLCLAAQCYAQGNTGAQTTNLSAIPTESYDSEVSSTTPDPSDNDSNPFASNAIGLGITVAGVLPFVLVLKTIVVWLFKWRERRRRKRRGTHVGRDGRVKKQDEEAVGFGMKAELSAKQARFEIVAEERRFEMEAEERRFEISGVDARVEMPVSEVWSGKKGDYSTQELRGHEVAQELRGDEHSHEGRPVYKQPEVTNTDLELEGLTLLPYKPPYCIAP